MLYLKQKKMCFKRFCAIEVEKSYEYLLEFFIKCPSLAVLTPLKLIHDDARSAMDLCNVFFQKR